VQLLGDLLLAVHTVEEVGWPEPGEPQHALAEGPVSGSPSLPWPGVGEPAIRIHHGLTHGCWQRPPENDSVGSCGVNP